MKYIHHFVISLISILTFVGLFNWLVDPYGLHWSPQIEGINSNKVEAGTRSRLTKKEVIKSIKPQVVLIGNSRVEMGIDPASNWLKDKSVYNFGIPGLGLQFQLQNALSQLKDNENLELLIISVDYLDFLYNRQTLALPKPPQHNPLSLESQSDISNLLEKVPLLFSIDALKSSLITLLAQNSSSSAITHLGFNNGKHFYKTVEVEGKAPLFKQKLNQLVSRLKDKGYQHKSRHWQSLDPNMLALQELFTLANNKQVSIRMFINPYHFSYLHLLNDLGYWQDFIHWKTSLAEVIGQSTSIYDFSGLNQYTLEPVTLEQPKNAMNWFWEPAHYRKELGELVLEEMLLNKTDKGFGRALNKDTSQHLIAQDNEMLKTSAKSWEKLKSALSIN